MGNTPVLSVALGILQVSRTDGDIEGQTNADIRAHEYYPDA